MKNKKLKCLLLSLIMLFALVVPVSASAIYDHETDVSTLSMPFTESCCTLSVDVTLELIADGNETDFSVFSMQCPISCGNVWTDIATVNLEATAERCLGSTRTVVMRTCLHVGCGRVTWSTSYRNLPHNFNTPIPNPGGIQCGTCRWVRFN